MEIPLTQAEKAANFEAGYQELIKELNRMEASHYEVFPEFESFVQELQ